MNWLSVESFEDMEMDANLWLTAEDLDKMKFPKKPDNEPLAKLVFKLKKRVAEQDLEITDLQSELFEIQNKINVLKDGISRLFPSFGIKEETPKKRDDYKQEHTEVPRKLPEKKLKPLKKVSRKAWGAFTPEDVNSMEHITLPIRNVHITYSTEAFDYDDPEERMHFVYGMQKMDVMNGLPDIAHNFIISKQGEVFEGRGWYLKPEISSMNPEFKDETIDIAFLGQYSKEDYPKELEHYTKELIQMGIDKGLVIKGYNLLTSKY